MLIKYRKVDICQESQEVLDDINLTVNEKEFIYLTGKVGSGKSSLLKTMYCELSISSGEASVMGFDITKIKKKKVPDLRKKMGIIFQDFQLLNDRTVEANLRFVLKATGWKDKEKIKERIAEVLQLVGMETKGYKLPSELSGGEQQRIAIARSMLNSPALILADEPTGNLDTETSMQIVGLLHQLVEEQGTTVVMVTHNMQIIEKFPGRVIVCADKHLYENGEIVNDTDTEDESQDNVSEVNSDNCTETKAETTMSAATEKEEANDTEEAKEEAKKSEKKTEDVFVSKEKAQIKEEDSSDDEDSAFCEEDAFSFDLNENKPISNEQVEQTESPKQENLAEETNVAEEKNENSSGEECNDQPAVADDTNADEEEKEDEVKTEVDNSAPNRNNFQNDFHKKKKKNKKHKRR